MVVPAAGSVAQPVETTVDRLVSLAVARDPAGAALSFRDVTLSRRELLHRVQALASVLRAHRIGPESRVAIYVERGLELVIAQIAVLFAGGAHLAIDTSDPIERSRFMLEDLQPDLLLAHGGVPEIVPAGLPVLDLAAVAPPAPAADEIDHAEPAAHLASSACYFIYTSGSTGRPKASLIEHRSLASRLNWLIDTYPLTPTDRVLYKTACGFDVSVAELYWPIVSGAELVIAEPDRHRDVDYLADMVLRRGITVLHFVPSLLDLFLAGRPADERYDGLRLVLAGGEALSPELARRFADRSLGQLHNLYGPSECTIYSTSWQCPAGPVELVPIGSAVSGAQLFVLDEHGNPASSGELYIAGDGLAREYVGRPELTAERFRQLNHPELPPVRAYRTGDLVREVSPGCLHYLGRVDRQVKVRGYRVELGEIETVIRRLPEVIAVTVLAVPQGRTQVLVAFVAMPSTALQEAAHSTGPALSDRIRDEVRRVLPDYMVPAVVLLLPELPLTPNGKVDHEQLLARYQTSSEPEPGDRSDALSSLWCSVLTVAEPDADDDFFDLGGNSLVALDFVEELSRRMGFEVAVRELFQNSTYGEFSARLRELETGQPSR